MAHKKKSFMIIPRTARSALIKISTRFPFSIVEVCPYAMAQDAWSGGFAWDQFESLQQGFRPGNPPNAAALQHGAPPQPPNNKDVRDGPPCAALSLERYLQLGTLLSGGGGCSWTVQKLGELERSAVKVDDLKQMLALNGCLPPSSRPKQEILERMHGMQLAAPVCHIRLSPGLPRPRAPLRPELAEGMRRALDWEAEPSQASAIAAAVAQQGFYSYCELPELPQDACFLTTHGDSGDFHAFAGNSPNTAAHSGTTFASQPARPLVLLDETPQFGYDTVMEKEPAWEPPEWLVEAVHEASAVCQGSKSTATGKSVVGHKVAIIFTKNFRQGGTDGIVDFLDQGIHLGQVIEWIGDSHDAETCSPACTQRHNFCFVRVSASRTTATSASRRRLDLEVDLRDEWRLKALEDLLDAGDEGLEVAWLLVEPQQGNV